MIKEREFTFDERIDIANHLSMHHVIFQTFWSVGKPLFTESIDTAAVGFDRNGHILYLILNPHFWDSLDMTNKAFVIAHECLHVILNHGQRGMSHPDHESVNIAQDIVINEMLVNSFGFNKFSIKDWDKFCFVGTVFSSEEIIEHGIHTRGSFHYYLELMGKTNKQTQQCTMDQHARGGNLADIDPAIQNFIDQAQQSGVDAATLLQEEITPKLSEKEKYDLGKKLEEEIKDAVGSPAGKLPMGAYIAIDPNPPKKKKKWEEVVKRHLKSGIRYETVEKPSYITRDRRSMCLPDDILLQGHWKEEVPSKERYRVVFFLDTSGSCYSYAKRFVKMLQTIPDDKFEIDAYAFDCNLYPIDLKTGHVRGGGGTYFHILDQKVREITAKKKHPDAVFVLSDGDGNAFSPEMPKRWHWILTPHHNTRLIPKESPKHDMKNFE